MAAVASAEAFVNSFGSHSAREYAALAREEAQRAEHSARQSGYRLGAEITSLREELQEMTRPRLIARSPPSIDFPDIDVSPRSSQRFPSLPSSPALSVVSTPKGSGLLQQRRLNASLSRHLSKDTSSRNPSAVLDEIDAACKTASVRSNARKGGHKRKEPQSVGFFPDRAHDEEELRKEIVALKQECAANTQRATAIKGELRICDETVVSLKKDFLQQLALFDEAVTAARTVSGVFDVPKSGLMGSWAEAYLAVPVRRHKRQNLSLHTTWELDALRADVLEELRTSESDLREHASLCARCAEWSQCNEQLMRELVEEENSAQEWSSALRHCRRNMDMLSSELDERRGVAEVHLEAETAAQRRVQTVADHHISACADEAEAISGKNRGLRVQLEELEKEAQKICGRIATEESALVQCPMHVPRRETVLEELQERDAVVWAINHQLVSAWREEDSFAKRDEVEHQVEELLRDELVSERAVVEGLRREEMQLQAGADALLHEVKSELAFSDSEEHELFNDAMSKLEGELHDSSIIQSPEVGLMATSQAGATRQALTDEFWKLDDELKEVREAVAIARSEAVASARHAAPLPSQRQKQFPSNSSGSGLQRALRAWEQVVGDDTSVVAHCRDKQPLDDSGYNGLSYSSSHRGWSKQELDYALGKRTSPRSREGGVTAQALDVLESLMQGRASKKDVDLEWSRLCEAESKRIADLTLAAGVDSANDTAALPWQENVDARHIDPTLSFDSPSTPQSAGGFDSYMMTLRRTPSERVQRPNGHVFKPPSMPESVARGEVLKTSLGSLKEAILLGDGRGCHWATLTWNQRLELVEELDVATKTT